MTLFSPSPDHINPASFVARKRQRPRYGMCRFCSDDTKIYSCVPERDGVIDIPRWPRLGGRKPEVGRPLGGGASFGPRARRLVDEWKAVKRLSICDGQRCAGRPIRSAWAPAAAAAAAAAARCHWCDYWRRTAIVAGGNLRRKKARICAKTTRHWGVYPAEMAPTASSNIAPLAKRLTAILHGVMVQNSKPLYRIISINHIITRH